MTFRITKANTKVKLGAKYLCDMTAQDHLSQYESESEKIVAEINFTSICVAMVNSVQTRCSVKVEAQKVNLSGDFLGALFFSGAPVLWEFHHKTLKFNKLTDVYKYTL